MIEKKLSRKIYFLIVFLCAVILTAFRAIFLLTGGQVVDETNAPLSSTLVIFICLVIVVVCCTYAITVFTLTRQVIKLKSTAFVVDAQGIHCTFVIINLFAFVIAVPVKHIPWESVSYINTNEDNIHIRMDTKKLNACFLAKIILVLSGYRFCQTLITAKLTTDEIRLISDYCYNTSSHTTDENIL